MLLLMRMLKLVLLMPKLMPRLMLMLKLMPMLMPRVMLMLRLMLRPGRLAGLVGGKCPNWG